MLDLILTVDIFMNDDPDPGTVIDVNGNKYQNIMIGDKEWMAENLRTSSYRTGDPIPTGLNNTE